MNKYVVDLSKTLKPSTSPEHLLLVEADSIIEALSFINDHWWDVDHYGVVTVRLIDGEHYAAPK